MSKIDILLLAVKNFTRRMTRSILTITGVVIGSLAIVSMVSIGIGMQEMMMLSMMQWGDLTTINVSLYNLESGGGGRDVMIGGGGVVVMSSTGGSPANSTPRSGKEKNPYLEAIANIETLEHVVTAMPMKNDWGVRFVSGKYVNPWPQLMLVDTAKLHYFNIKTSQGRMLEPGDEGLSVVLNPTMGTEFYNLRARDPYDWSKRPTDETGMPIPYVDVYNDEIQLTFDNMYGERMSYSGTPRKRAELYDLNVVGYQTDSGQYSYTNFMDLNSYIELKTEYYEEMMKNLSKEEQEMYRQQIDELSRFTDVIVKIDDHNNAADTVEAIRALGYDAYNNMEYIDQINEQMAMIQLVMGAIGAVALLVAAINIANTMIMSIYERTKEIGIIKVIGCRLGDICMLFLLEAAIIGLIGGVIGIGASYGVSAILNNLDPETISGIFGFYIDPNVGGSLSVIPIWLVGGALAIAVGIAVLAGLYPSIRAMRLSALDAIRNE